MSTPGERLRDARVKAGYETAADAARQFEWHPQNVRDHEADRRKISPDQARRYARAYKITPTWLLYGDKATQSEELPFPETGRLPIRFTVAAGAWEPVEDWRDEPLGFEEAHRVPAYDSFPQWLERVVGDSYNKKIPDGSLIHVVDAVALGYAPTHGDTVVVCRRRAQKAFVERSVKEVVLTPFGIELWPRSFNPKWDQPLNYTVGAKDGEEIEVEIVGKVIRSYQELEGSR